MSVVKKCFKLLKLKQHFDKAYPEREVIAYLRWWNRKLKTDEYWNLYLINPGTPLISAHMDTVQKEDSVKNLWTLRLKNWIIKANDAVIWWDDKCWIAIAMELYEQLWDRISLLFSRQEETWCNWAREFCNHHKDLVEQCSYCLVLDRKWSWDIIWYQNQYCSKEFEDEIARLLKDFWYKPEKGLCSDANQISKIINAVNLSVGYYNPHTKTEYINCDNLINAYQAALYVVEHLDWDYPIYEYKYYNSSKTYNKWLWLFDYGYGYDDYDNDYWFSENWRYWSYLWSGWSNLYKGKKTKQKLVKGSNPLDPFIEVTKAWTIKIKQEVYLANVDDEADWIILWEWEYDVIESLDDDE